MNYYKIVQGILDIGEGMLRSGAENFRLEDSFYRMCRSYGFVKSDVFVIPSNIQVTVETPEGEIITQIRHVNGGEPNFDRLDYLNNLCRYVCQNTPDEKELHEKYLEVMNRPKQKRLTRYLAGIMGGTGFAEFFGSNTKDALVAAVVSILIVYVGDLLSEREDNLMVYNTLMAFMGELIIILASRVGLADHPDRIMIGIVMLLISGLSTTNGIRDILQSDFISGFLHIMSSMLGAAGIAFGIAIALLMFHEGTTDTFILNHSILIQLISCTIACTGFAWWFKIRGIQVVYSGIGAFFTWGIYVVVYAIKPSNFLATLMGAIFVAFYAFVMSRVNKAPSTIFLTASVFPLIPGPNLYYLMYACVAGDISQAFGETVVLFATCLAIAFGFIIVDVVSRSIMYGMKREYHLRKM